MSESHLSLVSSYAPKVTVTALAAPYWYGKLNGTPMLTPRSRGKDKVLLNHIYLLWNTAIPYESYVVGKPTARKAESSCGNRMSKKRTPAGRKVREIHNPLDRAAQSGNTQLERVQTWTDGVLELNPKRCLTEVQVRC